MAQKPTKTRPGTRVSSVPIPAPADTPPVISDASPQPAPGPANTETPMIERLSVPIDTKTGKIAENAMRDSTKSKLIAALDGSTLTARVSSNAPDDGSAAAIVGVLYDVIGSAAVLMAKSRGYSDRAAELLRYTEQEKALLMPPTLKVLAKYDLFGGKWADEIALAVTVGSITAAHVMAMQRVDAEPAKSPAPVEGAAA